MRPRHVEIQVLGDEHGNVVSLGERECSLQRRHQKVVEEAPSPVLTPELRRAMGAEAVKAAAAVGYVGAGTVEFLLDKDGRFYFLEMNTRLQVEHPVTELVTGIDLVQAQLSIAEGEPLDREWYDVEPRGHAIEVRVYAEDPFHGFTPSPGLITLLRLPEGPGVRNDFGVRTGSRVSIFYDPMLGKLIVWGKDRAQAMRRLGRALDELRVEGIRTTVPLYKALLADADFVAGRLDIDMLDRKLEAGELRPRVGDEAALDGDAAAAYRSPRSRPRSSTWRRQPPAPVSPAATRRRRRAAQRLEGAGASRRAALGRMELVILDGESERRVSIERAGAAFVVSIDGRSYVVDRAVLDDRLRSLVIDGRQFEVSAQSEGDGRYRISALGRETVGRGPRSAAPSGDGQRRRRPERRQARGARLHARSRGRGAGRAGTARSRSARAWSCSRR